MRAYLGNAARWFGCRLRADAVLYVGIAVYTLAGLNAMRATETEHLAAYAPYTQKWVSLFLLFFPFMALAIDSSSVIHRFDRRRRIAFSRTFSPRRVAYLAAGTLLGLSLYFFQGKFTSLKNAMFAWNGGFLYDRTQADLDRLIHFGVAPWRLIEPLIANDAIFSVIEFNYDKVYFILSFSALYFVMTSPRAERFRTHYVAVFMLAWIVVGNALAGLFLSAGPAYYGFVTGDTGRFAELLGYIQRDGGLNTAATYQKYLWELHQAGRAEFASGISAFPSVHVAMAAVNMFFAFDVSRRLGIVMTAYTVIIMISSVALGWHYAIDGYVAVLAVAMLYFGLRFLRGDAFRTMAPASSEKPGAPSPAGAFRVS